jgi:hypothetical protein
MAVRDDQRVEKLRIVRRFDPPAAVLFPRAALHLDAEADVGAQVEVIRVVAEVLQGLVVADVGRPLRGEREVAQFGQALGGDQVGGAVDRGARRAVEPVAAEVGVALVDDRIQSRIEKLLGGDEAARSGSDDTDAHRGDCNGGAALAGRPGG